MDIVGRVQRLLMSPKAEWDVIDQETVEPQPLIIGYVLPLAAIPAIATIIGMGLIGFGGIKIGLGSAITIALTQFILAVVFVFVFAFIIDALAPTFGAQKNFNQALKVTAFAPTAAWVSGIFGIIPLLGILSLVGALYSLYLLFVGLPKMMKPPADKAMAYTIVSIVVAIVAGIIINAAAAMFTPKTSLSGMYSQQSQRDLDKRAEAMNKAAESGDIGAIMSAATGMLGGDPNAPIVDGEALRKLAPGKVAGLERSGVEVETMTAPFKAVIMTADYGESGKTVQLKVTNSPMISAMMGVAGFSGATYNRTNDDGYERLTRDGDAMIIEEWNKSSKRGRYGRSVAGSFLIEAEGYGVDMKDLERAVAIFSERELKNLPKAS